MLKIFLKFVKNYFLLSKFSKLLINLFKCYMHSKFVAKICESFISCVRFKSCILFEILFEISYGNPLENSKFKFLKI